MTAYLGPAGNLIEFACPSEEQIDQGDNLSLEWTIDGVQKAQVGSRAPRAWRVGFGTATPAQVGNLLGLLRGLYGPPPWTYVGPWAQVSNLLTEAQSMSAPRSWLITGADGPPVLLDNGTTPIYSVLNDGGAYFDIPAAPAVAGVPVTASMWGVGVQAFRVRVIFRDAENTWLSTKEETVLAPAGRPLVRGSVTATPPAGTTNVLLRVYDALRATMPAITWTPDLVPWMPGEDAPKVLVHGLSRAVQLAVRDHSLLRRQSVSFTIEEVGNA